MPMPHKDPESCLVVCLPRAAEYIALGVTSQDQHAQSTIGKRNRDKVSSLSQSSCFPFCQLRVVNIYEVADSTDHPPVPQTNPHTIHKSTAVLYPAHNPHVDLV